MALMTAAAVMNLAISCQNLVAPTTIVQMAQHESGFDPAARHLNPGGSVDVGLMQINDRNFGLLGLTPETALDPCRSIRAAADYIAILSRYNTGSPTRGIANGYVAAVQAVKLTEATATGPPAAPAQHDVFMRPKPGRELVFSSHER